MVDSAFEHLEKLKKEYEARHAPSPAPSSPHPADPTHPSAPTTPAAAVRSSLDGEPATAGNTGKDIVENQMNHSDVKRPSGMKRKLNDEDGNHDDNERRGISPDSRPHLGSDCPLPVDMNVGDEVVSLHQQKKEQKEQEKPQQYQEPQQKRQENPRHLPWPKRIRVPTIRKPPSLPRPSSLISAPNPPTNHNHFYSLIVVLSDPCLLPMEVPVAKTPVYFALEASSVGSNGVAVRTVKRKTAMGWVRASHVKELESLLKDGVVGLKGIVDGPVVDEKWNGGKSRVYRAWVEWWVENEK